jgi:hypothetical protein
MDPWQPAEITPLPELPRQSPTAWLKDSGLAQNPQLPGESTKGWTRRLADPAYVATKQTIKPQSIETLIYELKRCGMASAKRVEQKVAPDPWDGWQPAETTPLPEPLPQSPTAWLKDSGLAQNPQVLGESTKGCSRRLAGLAYIATKQTIKPKSIETLIYARRRGEC